MIVLTNISEGFENEKKYRLADYFNRWWDEYAKHPTEYITLEQYKAANAIRVWRTPALGVDTYASPDCGEIFEKALIELFDNDKLKHDFHHRMDFMNFIKNVVNKKQWIVHLEPPLEMPEQVIQYIGRCSKQACLSEYKITAMENENITFRYRDYQNSPDRRNPVKKELTLHYREFFSRLLQHVPWRYFRIVRYYGFYSNKGNLPKEYFRQDKEEARNMSEERRDYENPFFCECCQRMRVYVHTTIIRRIVHGKRPETLVFKKLEASKRKVA